MSNVISDHVNTSATTTEDKKFSVIIAVWDSQYEEYTTSGKSRDDWVDAHSFDTVDSARKFLRDNHIDAAYICDDEDMFDLVFP